MQDRNQRSVSEHKLSAALASLSSDIGCAPCRTTSVCKAKADGTPLFTVSCKQESVALFYGAALPCGSWTRLRVLCGDQTAQVVRCGADGSFFFALPLSKGEYRFAFLSESGSDRLASVTVAVTGKSKIFCHAKPFTVLKTEPFVTLTSEWGALWLTQPSARVFVGEGGMFDGAANESRFAIVYADGTALQFAVFDDTLSLVGRSSLTREGCASVAVAPLGDGWLVVSLAGGEAYYDRFSADGVRTDGGTEPTAAGSESVIAVKGDGSGRFAIRQNGKTKLIVWQS